jgi:hypothetical protein
MTVYLQTQLTLTPNSKQPCLPPLIQARQPRVSQQWTSAIHMICTALPPAVVLMNLLPQNKIYISDI